MASSYVYITHARTHTHTQLNLSQNNLLHFPYIKRINSFINVVMENLFIVSVLLLYGDRIESFCSSFNVHQNSSVFIHENRVLYNSTDSQLPRLRRASRAQFSLLHCTVAFTRSILRSRDRCHLTVRLETDLTARIIRTIYSSSVMSILSSLLTCTSQIVAHSIRITW